MLKLQKRMNLFQKHVVGCAAYNNTYRLLYQERYIANHALFTITGHQQDIRMLQRYTQCDK
jgi:hypothetical protein